MDCDRVPALLAENGRLKNLPSINNLFKQIMSAHRGDLIVEVTLAKVIFEFVNFNILTCKEIIIF